MTGIRWPGLLRIFGAIAIFLAGLIIGMEIGKYHRSVEAFAEAVYLRWECQE